MSVAVTSRRSRTAVFGNCRATTQALERACPAVSSMRVVQQRRKRAGRQSDADHMAVRRMICSP